MTENIDILMDLDPLQMTKDDVASIISYHRRNRAAQAAGGPRPKKDLGPSPQVDLKKLGLTNDAPSAGFTRRF